MINVSPLSGKILDTVFSVLYSGLSGDYIINWGDGTLTDLYTQSHIYSSSDIYNIFITNCNTTTGFSISAFPSILYEDTIKITYNTLSAYTGCNNTFNLNISSKKPDITVFLYSSGSSSPPASNDNSFWSHLNPEWSFKNDQGTKISEINITGSPVYSGTLLLGFSALTSVQYADDFPGNPNLFFTLKQSQKSILINSRAYASIMPTICAIIPNRIKITSDGINNLPALQWADYNVPYITSIFNDSLSCSNFIHYASGYLTEVKYAADCFGLNNNQYQSFLSEVNPYAIHNFFLPSSAIPADVLSFSEVACGDSPYEREITRLRQSPINVSISASGIFNVNGIIYSLTGVSSPFNIYPFENFNSFYRKGEDNNVYNLIKKAASFDLEQYPTFNTYLSTIAGEGDSLGRVYDKIQNFANDHTDIDTCQINSIYDISEKLNVSIDDFGIEFPEELKRVMNFFSIPLQKLIGTRCQCNTNFATCQNSCNRNICSLCGFDKKSNLGKQLNLTDNVSAGETILYRERGSDVYNFLPILPQSNNIYKLTSLTAQPIYSKGVTNFCFFEWDKTPQFNPVEGVINYKDSRNNLSPALSSYSDWYDEGGVIEETLNYILTKNLLDI